MLVQFEENSFGVWGMVAHPPKANMEREVWSCTIPVAYENLGGGRSEMIDVMLYRNFVAYGMTARKGDCIFAIGSLKKLNNGKLQIRVGAMNRGFVSISPIEKTFSAFKKKQREGETRFDEGWDDPVEKKRGRKPKEKPFNETGNYEEIDLNNI